MKFLTLLLIILMFILANFITHQKESPTDYQMNNVFETYKEIDDDHIIIKYDGKLYFATKIHAGGAYTAREYLVIGGEFKE